MNAPRTDTLWRVAIAAWGLAAAGVWAWTTSYEFTTYAPVNRDAGVSWPVGSDLKLADDRPTLLFFLHPRCPCTRASIRELERVLTGAGLSAAQQPKLIIVASLPADASPDWRDTDTVRRASALPRSEIVWDVDGVETSRFGVVTSGAVRLFPPGGSLLFAGGVTVSRGHEGNNDGSDRLHALLTQRSSERQSSTPVFGCRLCVAEAPRSGEAPRPEHAPQLSLSQGRSAP